MYVLFSKALYYSLIEMNIQYASHLWLLSHSYSIQGRLEKAEVSLRSEQEGKLSQTESVEKQLSELKEQHSQQLLNYEEQVKTLVS